MLIKDTITIPQLSGQKPRRLYIYLPPDYDESDEAYPVMYMFDGHNVFYDADATYGCSWRMMDYLEREDPRLMIVAVECNHEGNSRLCEYTPWSFREKGLGTIKALGDVYMDWLTKELKPVIDRDFRTQQAREGTYLCGSSMGGLMAVYGIAQYNSIFSRAAALSPSLWCAPDKIVQMIHNGTFRKETHVYMDYGSEELFYRKNCESALRRVTGAFMDAGVYVCSRIVPGGQHNEASWEKQIPIFMRCLDIVKS